MLLCKKILLFDLVPPLRQAVGGARPRLVGAHPQQAGVEGVADDDAWSFLAPFGPAAAAPVAFFALPRGQPLIAPAAGLHALAAQTGSAAVQAGKTAETGNYEIGRASCRERV